MTHKIRMGLSYDSRDDYRTIFDLWEFHNEFWGLIDDIRKSGESIILYIDPGFHPGYYLHLWINIYSRGDDFNKSFLGIHGMIRERDSHEIDREFHYISDPYRSIWKMIRFLYNDLFYESPDDFYRIYWDIESTYLG